VEEDSSCRFRPTLAWGIMAATLCAAGIWYCKTGYRSPQRLRRGVGLLVGVVFAVNGFVNSVWLGVYREGSSRTRCRGWVGRPRSSRVFSCAGSACLYVGRVLESSDARGNVRQSGLAEAA
jgi:hypothetical protein